MLALMRHRILISLGGLLIAVMLAACGGGTPEPTLDIEATVEAK